MICSAVTDGLYHLLRSLNRGLVRITHDFVNTHPCTPWVKWYADSLMENYISYMSTLQYWHRPK